jgi:tetratricopeptide (TPR) repeat protein
MRQWLALALIGAAHLSTASALAQPTDQSVLNDPRICSLHLDKSLTRQILITIQGPITLEKEIGFRPQDRIEACNRSLARGLPDEDKVHALKMRGFAKAQLKDYSGSIQDLNEALTISSNDSELLTVRARVHHAAGRKQDAFADLKTAIDHDATVEAHKLRADLYFAANDNEAALKDLNAIIKLAPGDWSSWNRRCWERATRMPDQLAAAEFDCNQALEFSPDNGAVLDSRGLVRFRQKRYQEAWADYDAAVRLLPKEPSPLYGRGIAAIALGRTKEGQADIAKAVSMNPSIAKTYASYGISAP